MSIKPYKVPKDNTNYCVHRVYELKIEFHIKEGG